MAVEAIKKILSDHAEHAINGRTALAQNDS
jgi:hypothetical protein